MNDAPRGPYRYKPKTIPHYLYRYYDANGRLLYVGCTNSPGARRESHRQGTYWFSEAVRVRHTVYPDRPTALEREREAIYAEKPKYNVKGRWLKGCSRDHWELEDYREFMWAVVEAATVVGPNTRSLIRAIVAEARDRYGVILMANVA